VDEFNMQAEQLQMLHGYVGEVFATASSGDF